jgi:hypothetical protein
MATLHFICGRAGAGIDEDTCKERVHDRNTRQPEGIFFGVVTDAQLAEVNPYFTPPSADEGFNVQPAC